MDVERIQKINNLALSLMKQGLAANREDAVLQAEKVFRGQDGTEDYKQMVRQMEGIGEERKAQEKHDGQSTVLPADALDEQKISQIMQQNTQFLVKTIKDFAQEMETLRNEVKMLRSQMTIRQAEARAAHAAEQQSQPNPAGQQEKTQSHPRSGNYKADDVSIEKFFYMGKK